MKFNSNKILFSTFLLLICVSLIQTAKETNFSNVSLIGDFSHFAESLFSDNINNKNDEYFIENKDNISSNTNHYSNILRNSGNSEYKDLTRIISSNNFDEINYHSNTNTNNSKIISHNNLKPNKEQSKNLKENKDNIKKNLKQNQEYNKMNIKSESSKTKNEVDKLKKEFTEIKKNDNVKKGQSNKTAEIKKEKSTEEILNEIYDDLV